MTTSIAAPNSVPEWLIDLRSVSRSFGDYQALSNITLQLPPGRIGLLGPNGAGKSTLLKIIMGLLAPSSGSGHVLGIALSSTSKDGNRTLRRQIGFMPENEALIPGLRGIEYVALAGELCGLPRRQAQRRAHEILSHLELEEARYRMLEDYSTGMKQRIKLAQALIHDPPLLLLDEPTSGLDPAGRDAMLRMLLELGRTFGKSFILSTHLLADVETVCDHLIILMNGQIRSQGPVAELCARRQQRYRLRLEGSSDSFRQALAAVGVDLLDNNARGDWRMKVPQAWNTRQFFELAAHHGVLIRGLMRDDETLEELFLRTVGWQ